MTKGKNFPKDVVDKWPEVFGEITLNVVPLQYLHAVKITFKNAKVWEIEIKKNVQDGNWDDFEVQIKEIVSQYESEIDNVDFQLNTEKIKKDISKHTKKFLNNRKLK